MANPSADSSLTSMDPAAILNAHCFRKLLDAMARPGTLGEVANLYARENGLYAASMLVLLTLCDHETSVYLDPKFASGEPEFLRFKCGCELTQRVEEADFCLFASMPKIETLAGLKRGSPQYPDRSAMAVIQLPELGTGRELMLRGPGIQSKQSLAVGGLDDSFLSFWAENNAMYPLGIDAFLTSKANFVALPRTLRMSEVS